MTKALAWPLVVVLLSLVYRGQFRALLDGVRLRRLKRGEWEADFETGVREVRAELPAKIPARITNSMDAVPESAESLLDVAPVEAVLRAWNDLEGKLMAAANRTGVSTKNLPECLRVLVEKGLIDPVTKDAIMGLRNMRNLAVHAPPDRLSPSKAREFVTMAEALVWSFEENLRKAGATSRS